MNHQESRGRPGDLCDGVRNVGCKGVRRYGTDGPIKADSGQIYSLT